MAKPKFPRLRKGPMDKQDYLVETIDRRKGERTTYKWFYERADARIHVKISKADGVIVRVFKVDYKQVK